MLFSNLLCGSLSYGFKRISVAFFSGFIVFISGCSGGNVNALGEQSVESTRVLKSEVESAEKIANRCEITGKIKRIVKVNMVAFNQPFWFNRMGASQLDGMIYALASDVVLISDMQTPLTESSDWVNGEYAGLISKVTLRSDKRPRPVVLRSNMNDCLEITFTNLLKGFGGAPTNTDYAGVHIEGTEVFSVPINQWYEDLDVFLSKAVSEINSKIKQDEKTLIKLEEAKLLLHVLEDIFKHHSGVAALLKQLDELTGIAGEAELTALFEQLELAALVKQARKLLSTGEVVGGIENDAAFIGKNSNHLAAPGEQKVYSLFIPAQGAFVLNSPADNFSNNQAGQTTAGLFGALNVQPEGAEYYRSQVTEVVMNLATEKDDDNNPLFAKTGQPLINYQAVFPDGNPVLRMLKKVTGEKNTFDLIYSDPTAIITGPNAGAFSATSTDAEFYKVPVTPERTQPWREFNIMYHEPTLGVQAFEQFRSKENINLNNTLGAGGDFFGINYGTAAIGPEILANRLQVGPMHDCVTCEYEEFFLSAWAVGDPAMIVDVPANFTNDEAIENGTSFPADYPPTAPPLAGVKATKAFYPDDPSNVYHSYMQDHVKMRIHHGGGTLHHLHHLHAHQWLHSPNSDDGHYLDSQLIGPGASFTLEMVHNGSGNRNQTVGDSIFHCHFYPHFAEGMWSLWRVHDVFESGTKLNTDGKPAKGSRALPDGEIVAGTPIPGLVPLPTRPMAPMPSEVHIKSGQVVFGSPENADESGLAVTRNPGFPFFIPGIAGERPPHPPMDFAQLNGRALNGGLPRHVIKPGIDKAGVIEYHNRFDFSKFYQRLDGELLPESGTPVELIAMEAHSIRNHPSFTPGNHAGNFILNGLPPQSGAPYADPCVSDFGTPVASASHPRRYRGVDLQMDVVLNKKGWHYSQQRFGVLWEDLLPTLNKERPPEPLFFRANSGDCIEYWLANVVPEYYELDDFQIRTPTDILGQHIHLVKFDVTSSDGGANGWNYEDGTFSPQAVVERIKSLNNGGGLAGYTEKLQPQVPTWLCDGLKGRLRKQCLERANADPQWLGAQATVQRWYADPQLNNLGEDRTLRTVFTHDHFSPSTHQQAGLYMGLLVEPEGSSWKDSETGTPFYTRKDGGPTSWQAVIETPEAAESYREFALEFQDFQLAYKKGSPLPQSCEITPLPASCYPAVNKKSSYANQDVLNKIFDPKSEDYVSSIKKITNGYSGYLAHAYAVSPPGRDADDTPTLISTTPPFALGTYSINYRNEPLPYRVWNPQNNTQTGDLAEVYRSIKRDDIQLNKTFSPSSEPLTAGVYPFDPATPLLRAFQGDNVQVRTLVGAHINMHNFSMQGVRWLFEPSNNRSGYRSNQPMGISEHFEMLFKVPPSTMNKVRKSTATTGGAATSRCKKSLPSTTKFADYLYNPSSEQNGLLNGNWGLMRSYLPGQSDLCIEPLPVEASVAGQEIKKSTKMVCPRGAPKREYNVYAIQASVTYNTRGATDPNALLYIGCDNTATPGCVPVAPIKADPFVLRAAAGECITVNLTNKFKKGTAALKINESISDRNPLFQFRYIEKTRKDKGTLKDMTLTPSAQVALAPQLVSYDINQSNGQNLGFNKIQTAAIGKTKTYAWYAGIIKAQTAGSTGKCDYMQKEGKVNYCYTDAEFGSANLLTADSVEQIRFGMLAGMVIEPKGSCWVSPNGRVNSGCSTSVVSFARKNKISGENSASLTGTSVTVYTPDSEHPKEYFREFVVMAQDSLYFNNSLYGFNYASDPMGGNDQVDRYFNFTRDNGTKKFKTKDYNVACAYANALGNPANGNNIEPKSPSVSIPANTRPYQALGDPQVAIFRANPGDPSRFRVMQPNGADQHVFELYGHVWQEEPYNEGSTVITNNPTSQWQGSRMGLSAADRFDIVLASAGGTFQARGDYLFRSFAGGDQMNGMWGIFRVGDPEEAYPAENPPSFCKPSVYNPENYTFAP